MRARQRAAPAVDKHTRQQAILDAAGRLLGARPWQLASMADVADEAGVAKGTVYLYFASQEELLLALHERGVDTFFVVLTARVEADHPLVPADITTLARTHLVAVPLCLPVAAHRMPASSRSAPGAAMRAFQERMGTRFTRAGAALERRFPQLRSGDGAALLRHTYALVVGLWQLSAERFDAAPGVGRDSDEPPVGLAADIERALAVLWAGALGTFALAVPR